MNTDAKIGLSVLAGAAVLGVGAIAVKAAQVNRSLPGVTPPTPPPPVTTPPSWTRATTINPGDYVRLSLSESDLTAFSKALSRMAATDPEKVALGNAMTAAINAGLITTAGTPADLAAMFGIVLSAGTVASAFVPTDGTLNTWYRAGGLPSDWPTDDPSPSTEFQAQFRYGGSVYVLVSSLPLPVLVWTSKTAGKTDGGVLHQKATPGVLPPPASSVSSSGGSIATLTVADAVAAYTGTSDAPWFPPPGAVGPTDPNATALSLVTDPVLVCMAQDALNTVTTFAGYAGKVYSGGVTGAYVAGDAFSVALAGYQTIAAPGLLNQGSVTGLRTDGALDYRTLGQLIFGAALLGVVKSTLHTTPTPSTSGIDGPLTAMASSAFGKIASAMTPAMRTTLGISTSPSLQFDLAAFQKGVNAQYHTSAGGDALTPNGVLDWTSWGLLVAFGGG